MMKYNIRSTFHYYKENNKDSTVQRDRYNRLASLYCEFLQEKVIEGYEVRLPCGMGSLEVIGRRPKKDENGNFINLPVDYKATKKYWEKYPELENKKFIYILNEHSNFYKYKITWKKGTIRYKNLFRYQAARGDQTKTDSSIRTAVHKNILKGTDYRTA